MQHAFFHERKRCRGDDEFRQRRKPEQRIQLRGFAGFAIGTSRRTLVHDFSVPRNDEYEADDVLVGNGAIYS
jgi:hypothetical protein